MRDEHYFIAELLQKYPDLNQEEREQFNRWLEQGNNKDFFSQILDKEILEEELRQLEELRIEANQRHSWEKLLQFRVKKQKLNAIWLNNWKMYAAAASIITILGVGGLIWYQSHKVRYLVVQGKENQVPVVADVDPGQYKAKLTLADGSIIVLDSFSNSQIVQQGRTSVYLKDGELVYKQNGNITEDLYNTLSTAKGETYGMVLADGSKVWLNSQSSLRYPVAFSGDERRVEITGEAYFEVATAHLSSSNSKSRKLPFVVSLNGIEVKVLGTKFNINSYLDEVGVKATLLEGKISVRSKSNKAEIILQPGQQAKLNKETQQLNILDDVDVDEVVAWHYGYFQFGRVDLKTVLKQLTRWYDVEVEYHGNVPNEEFGGKISRSNTLKQVLQTLESNDVHFRLEGRKIIVSP